MKKKKEIKIAHIFGVFVIILAVLSVIMIIGTSHIEKTVNQMQDSTTQYIVEENSINQMREVSDYLTGKCQSFISTGNIKEAKLYFQEVDVNMRREASLDAVRQYGENNAIYLSLSEALKASDELAETEVYAMRLAAEGYDLDTADISENLVNVALSEEDAQLSNSKKRQKSRNMVFDDNYNNKKNDIWDNVATSTEELMSIAGEREMAYYKSAKARIITQGCLLLLLLVLAVILLFAVARLVILPLRASEGYIREHDKLPVKGAVEYKYLARAYNSMLEATQQHHEMLSYEATHDEMTSLYNRKFFDMKCEELAGEDIALMIVDVDFFKSINDTYGHETGDKVLRKVAGILSSSFRSEDFVCRIGGDEFAVLMVQMHPELNHVIEEKIAAVKKLLNEKNDGLPDVTLSFGIAFSEAYSSEDTDADRSEALFRCADQALYRTKEAGRNGYTFY